MLGAVHNFPLGDSAGLTSSSPFFLEALHHIEGREIPHLPDSAEEWAPLLTMACRANKQGIIGKGRVFHAAKSRLDHGEWSRIWRLANKKDRPPTSKRNGDRYALIGQEFGDANETGSSHLLTQLPDCVDALHYLAEMGRRLVLELVLDGSIHEGLTASKARELRNQYRPDLNKQRPFTLKNWAAQLDRLVGVIEEKAGPEDRAEAVRKLEEAIQRLKTKTSEGPEADADNEGKAE